MNFSVIHALVLRYLYLYGRNKVRLVELFFWPTVDLLVWGNLSVWLATAGGRDIPAFIPMLIGGVILWDVVFRAQQGVAISFLEDVWTRNLLNIFAAPVRPVEYVTAGFVVGFLRILVTVVVLSALAAAFYHFNVFQFHWHLVPFFGLTHFLCAHHALGAGCGKSGVGSALSHSAGGGGVLRTLSAAGLGSSNRLVPALHARV
jgi:ABC-2 type transport system permease protein